jgi:predicted HTH domain antitoxin
MKHETLAGDISRTKMLVRLDRNLSLQNRACGKGLLMTHRMTIEYPETLPDALQESPEQFEEEARIAMAVKLFELKRISSGTAAALAGLDRAQFLLQLSKFGVSMIDYDPEELQSDIANA